jgi:excisionase family DNA binding protein
MNEKSPSTFDIVTAKEAAKILQISKSKLYQIMKTDKAFPAVQLGRKWIVYKAKLPEWFESKLPN